MKSLVAVVSLWAAFSCVASEPTLDSSRWPTVVPHAYDYGADPASVMKGPYFKGQFVMADADQGGKPNAKYLLRRRFTIRGKPVEAHVQGMGVFFYTFRLNGKRLIASRCTDDRSSRDSAYAADALSAVKDGENVFEADYTTSGAASGGIVCEIFLRYADGSFDRISSDGQFESSVDGNLWSGVRLSRPPPNETRYSRLAYIDYANPQKVLRGGPRGIGVDAGSRVLLDYYFAGTQPQGEFTVRIRMNNGGKRDIWSDEVSLGPQNVKVLGDGEWRLSVPFDVPMYFPSGTYRLTLSSNAIWCREGSMDGSIELKALNPMPGYEQPLKSEIREVNGRLCLTLNGKPIPVLWGTVPPRIRPDLTVRHGDMPLTVVTVQNFHLAWHPQLGEYNFVHLDEMAERYRRDYPEAYFIWDLTVYPPFDFAKKFPDEMSKDDHGEVYSNGRFSWSYSSKIAMAELKEMVERAIRHVEASPYANRVIGYRVNSGQYTEWIGWSPKSLDRAKDFSRPAQRAYAQYAAERHPEIADPHVPSVAERHELDDVDSILWDQKRHANTIAYKDFDSWIIARDILELCGHAKDVLRELGRTKIVGTYYGYTHNMNWCGYHQYQAHFALQEILENNCGRIDFLMSPQGYFRFRNFGDTCTDMKPFATMAAAGILPVVEDDTRTHNHLPSRYSPTCCQALTPDMTKSILIRNGAIQLCRNTVPYFYAISEGFDFAGPECAEVGKGLRALMEFCRGRKVSRNAEVAIVASERSVTALPAIRRNVPTGEKYQLYGKEGEAEIKESEAAVFHGEVFGLMHSRFSRCGTPVDYVLAEDLKNRPGNYRLYVFLNLFRCDEATVEAVKRLRERGASMLWLYAPGYLNGNTVQAMQKLTGIEFEKIDKATVAGVTLKEDGRFMGTPNCKVSPMFCPVGACETMGWYENGKPGLVRFGMGKSQNWFFGGWQMDQKFIKEIVRKSGVHVYCDSDDPIEANDSLVTLHARSAGVKTILLPRRATVVDVFGKRVVARNADSFTFEATLHSSYLFYYGEDAEKFMDGLITEFRTPEGVAGRADDLGGGVWRVRLAAEDGSFSERGAVQALAAFMGENVPSFGAPDGSTVEVSQKPFAVRFRAKSGRLVREITSLVGDVEGFVVKGTLPAGEGVYGFGERLDRLNQRGQKILLCSSDGWNNSDTTYAPIPFFVTTSGAGVFVNNYGTITADMGASRADEWSVTGRGRRIDLYVWATDRILDAVKGVHRLQGGSLTPPDWAMGPVICRYGPDLSVLDGYTYKKYTRQGYWEGKALLGVGVKEMLTRYEAMGAKPKAFIMEGWSIEMFGDSEQARKRREALKACGEFLRSKDVKMLVYMRVGSPIDLKCPGFKDEFLVHADVFKDGRLLQSGTDRIPDVYLNGVNINPDSGKIAHSNIALDITNPEMWNWYVNVVWKELTDLGVAGVKIDFCEEMPDDGHDYGTVRVNYKWHNPGVFDGAAVHHAYPAFFVSRFTREMARLTDGKGGFMVLTRGGGIGSGRNPYMWAGDQTRSWNKLDDQVLAVLNSGMSGIPFMSYDYGGYQYDGGSRTEPAGVMNLKTGAFDLTRTEPKPDEETVYVRRGKKLSAEEEERIFSRALAFTAFMPCMQSHGYVRNVYDFGEATQRQYLTAVAKRDELAQYIRKAIQTAAEQGVPVVRPLVLKWQDDPNTYSIFDEFMLGDAILVAPVFGPETTRDVYLPQGLWKDVSSGKIHRVDCGGMKINVIAPIGEVPVFRLL